MHKWEKTKKPAPRRKPYRNTRNTRNTPENPEITPLTTKPLRAGFNDISESVVGAMVTAIISGLRK